jgi:hypothetical protein
MTTGIRGSARGETASVRLGERAAEVSIAGEFCTADGVARCMVGGRAIGEPVWTLLA